ncbi:hypothetical protein, partial [Undibacterium umbellatum]|uniref:hypothetical protein n=1 Tax=Undibacterium umbellatum TaxID=2762300 RepID=UPI003BB809E4
LDNPWACDEIESGMHHAHIAKVQPDKWIVRGDLQFEATHAYDDVSTNRICADYLQAVFPFAVSLW